MDSIVLNALPYGERDRIITLITSEGILKCFIKLPRRPNLIRLALATPFTRGVYQLRKTKSSLYRFLDGTPIDQHLGLRNSLNRLETAKKICNVLLETQWQGKPSGALYTLFTAFLKQTSESDQSLFVPFLIKLLKHEGQFDPALFDTTICPMIEKIADAKTFDTFPTLPPSLESDIYSKVMEVLAAST